MESNRSPLDGRFTSPTSADLEAQREAKQTEVEARTVERKEVRKVQLHPIFEERITELRDVKLCDPKTVKRNEQALARLTVWLDAEGIEATAAAEDRTILNRYFGSLRGDLAESTIETELIIIRAAYRFAFEELQAIPSVPRITFKPERHDDEEPKTYSNHELRVIRSWILDDLDEMIFYGLAYTGLRREELCKLKWSDVDFANRELRVVGKGRKLRKVPIHPVLFKVLRKHCPQDAGHSLVLGKGGSVRNVNARIEKLLKRAGVDGGNRPAHSFRKTVASVLTEEGAKTNDIDKILGWSPPNVRERYYTRTSPNLQEAICLLYRTDPIEQKPSALVAVA
jgi:integrase/recombinase XerC